MEAIKPKDFFDQIPKPEVHESLSVWRRKRLQSGKDIIPRRKGVCSSCLFCSQNKSVGQCHNVMSKNYGYKVSSDDTCGLYMSNSY